MTARKEGFIDGLLGRNSANPYSYAHYSSFEDYTVGYLHGMELRHQYGITLKVERRTDDE